MAVAPQVLRADAASRSVASVGAALFRDILGTPDAADDAPAAVVDMLELPPRLRLHPRYRGEWRLAPGSSLVLERRLAGEEEDGGTSGRAEAATGDLAGDDTTIRFDF